MAEAEADLLREAVENMRSGTATLGQMGHRAATRAYAWSSPIEASAKRRFFAVLHTDRIGSPIKAARAPIVAEHRRK